MTKTIQCYSVRLPLFTLVSTEIHVLLLPSELVNSSPLHPFNVSSDPSFHLAFFTLPLKFFGPVSLFPCLSDGLLSSFLSLSLLLGQINIPFIKLRRIWVPLCVYVFYIKSYFYYFPHFMDLVSLVFILMTTKQNKIRLCYVGENTVSSN